MPTQPRPTFHKINSYNFVETFEYLDLTYLKQADNIRQSLQKSTYRISQINSQLIQHLKSDTNSSKRIAEIISELETFDYHIREQERLIGEKFSRLIRNQ
jgi:superfamily I DNA and RNA helicase